MGYHFKNIIPVGVLCISSKQRSVCDSAKIQNPLGDGDSTSSVQCLVSPPSSPTTTSNDEL
jgi:hypothetical protein